MSSSELLEEPKRRRKRRTLAEKIDKQVFRTGRKLRKAFGGAEFEESEEMEGGARCCFNSTFCKGTDHYKRPKPAGYKSKYQIRKQGVTPPYMSVSQLGGSYGGKRKSDEEMKEEIKQTMRDALQGLSPEQIRRVLDSLMKESKRKINKGEGEPSSKKPTPPPPPPPPSAPAIPVGSGRPAKTAQQHAQEAIAQIQAILGDIGPMPDVTPREALKDLGKAKYKQTKYETAVKKDKAYTESTGVERPRKAESPWITHVKTYARHHDISYKQALTDAGPSYHAPKPPIPPFPPVGRRGIRIPTPIAPVEEVVVEEEVQVPRLPRRTPPRYPKKYAYF